jgi:hypothetical protein
MTIRTIALAALLCGAAAAQAPAPYSAIEVDPFLADRAVAVPSDYQMALVEDIAREASLVFPTVIIVRAGDPPPFGHAVLRISGTVVRFKPGDGVRKPLGFGSGATMLQAHVRFADASTGQVLLIRQVQGASDSVARKIVKYCNAAHLVASQ